jgi:hypothetical protein
MLAADDTDPADLLEIEGMLLEGVDLSGHEAFDSWLIVARHRMAALLDARLRQLAVASLATGNTADAVVYAGRLVAANPFEEGNHELLVRALAMSGDAVAAERQIALAEDTLARELGVGVSAALREAATTGPRSAMTVAVGGRAAALSELDAGRAAVAAGAIDAGLQCLRRAVVEAERCGDIALQAEALNALGGALVHAARGRDEEGAILLRWPNVPATPASRPSHTASWVTSTRRPGGGRPQRPGWTRRTRWPVRTRSAPRSSASGA